MRVDAFYPSRHSVTELDERKDLRSEFFCVLCSSNNENFFFPAVFSHVMDATFEKVKTKIFFFEWQRLIHFENIKYRSNPCWEICKKVKQTNFRTGYHYPS